MPELLSKMLLLCGTRATVSFVLSPLDPHIGARTHMFRTLLCLGSLDQARLWYVEALADARQLSPYTLAYALLGWFC